MVYYIKFLGNTFKSKAKTLNGARKEVIDAQIDEKEVMIYSDKSHLSGTMYYKKTFWGEPLDAYVWLPNSTGYRTVNAHIVNKDGSIGKILR